MKLLFLGRRDSYFRNFESVLYELAAGGHQVHLAMEHGPEGDHPIVERLAAQSPNITFGWVPARQEDDWTWVASRFRLGLDYLRYQHPLFDDTPKLRARARERTPGIFVRLGEGLRRWARWLRKPVAAVLRRLERAVPMDPAIREFVSAQRPDVVLLTPLVDVGSSQIDYLRAARMLGVPTALCVWSWDHLSSKALIRECPDRVIVWNETQKDEAVRLHGVPADRVVVTGAQCFDKWFDRRPSRDLSGLCADAGLPHARPYLLYVCSAPFGGSQPEAPFVVEWIRHVRASVDPTLASMPILVRPHPSRMPEWQQVDLGALEGVSVWGSSPVDEPSQADYFDSLYFAAVVVGLNTSAFIEAGILGRPVHTILLPEWHDNQMGTVHFRYLLNTAGGLLNAATSFDDHIRQLTDVLANPSAGVRPFVEAFVRPYGLGVAATPRFVESVEEMARLAPTAVKERPPSLFSRWLLDRVRARRYDWSYEPLLLSERELESVLRMRGHRERTERRNAEIREARAAIKRERAVERERALAEARAAREAARLERHAKREQALAEHRAAKAARRIARKEKREVSAQ